MWSRDRPSPLPFSQYYNYYLNPSPPPYLQAELIQEQIRIKSIEQELVRVRQVRKMQLEQELRQERLAQVELELATQRKQRKQLETARAVLEGGVRESALGRSRRQTELQESEKKLERAKERHQQEELNELEWEEREVKFERDLAFSRLSKEDTARRSRVEEDVSHILRRY